MAPVSSTSCCSRVTRRSGSGPQARAQRSPGAMKRVEVRRDAVVAQQLDGAGQQRTRAGVDLLGAQDHGLGELGDGDQRRRGCRGRDGDRKAVRQPVGRHGHAARGAQDANLAAVVHRWDVGGGRIGAEPRGLHVLLAELDDDARAALGGQPVRGQHRWVRAQRRLCGGAGQLDVAPRLAGALPDDRVGRDLHPVALEPGAVRRPPQCRGDDIRQCERGRAARAQDVDHDRCGDPGRGRVQRGAARPQVGQLLVGVLHQVLRGDQRVAPLLLGGVEPLPRVVPLRRVEAPPPRVRGQVQQRQPRRLRRRLHGLVERVALRDEPVELVVDGGDARVELHDLLRPLRSERHPPPLHPRVVDGHAVTRRRGERRIDEHRRHVLHPDPCHPCRQLDLRDPRDLRAVLEDRHRAHL